MSGSRTTAFCGLVAALAFTGCGDKYDGRVEVSGSVTLKKQPIKDNAQIEFVPLDGQGTSGTAVSKDGAYKFPREQGLKPGKYLVRVSLGDGKTAVNPVDENNPPGPGGGSNVVSKELVPDSWNVKSKEERTVTADAPNVFNLEIP